MRNTIMKHWKTKEDMGEGYQFNQKTTWKMAITL